jgi:tetratricopeptide (TPR) repeat protein
MQPPESPVRISNSRSHSNPILESERSFQRGGLRRDNERRQLDRLLQLQESHVPIYRKPEFIRVDASDLKVSNGRISVVGLVVDESNIGLVTQLRVSPSLSWEISVELPFRQAQIQSLLLRLVNEVGIDEGLPELLAFKISDTLCEGMHGDSMDIACLLAIVDAANGSKHELLSAAAAVVLPLAGVNLKRSESVRIKLNAFVREFGRGSLLVRMREDTEAEKFDDYFDVVWPVFDLHDLAARLHREGLMAPLNHQVSLASAHALAISTRTQHLLSSESTLGEARDFLRRVKARVIASTPLQIKLEVSYSEEDLHRHCGDFDEALKARAARLELERNPLISCYERMADSDNRHAAALYDAHRFREAVECLEPWFSQLQADPRICFPETRAFLFNTLGRCLVVLGDPRWESVLRESLRIQQTVSPEDVTRTENYIIHGLLKSNRLDEAASCLDNLSDPKDYYRVWLRAEHARRMQTSGSGIEDEAIFAISPTFHVFGFAMQAAARQQGRDLPTRIKYLQNARDCFLHGVEADRSNVKRLLSLCCGLAISVALEDDLAFRRSLSEFEGFCERQGLNAFRTWYDSSIQQLKSRCDWSSVEDLFSHIPHL